MIQYLQLKKKFVVDPADKLVLNELPFQSLDTAYTSKEKVIIQNMFRKYHLDTFAGRSTNDILDACLRGARIPMYHKMKTILDQLVYAPQRPSAIKMREILSSTHPVCLLYSKIYEICESQDLH